MKLTAKEVYEKLLNEDRILTLKGQIKFFLGDVSIIVKQRDVVGNIMQEWLQGWFDERKIEYALSENTQMPPDFYLNPNDLTVDLLEVKAFNRNAGPGFDIADFRMYQNEIIEKPYMLDVEYLIFGYDMSDEGIVTIKDVWLKKVWEITRRMEEWPINLQVKEKVVHKIRPGIWYSDSDARSDYAIFECIEDFISALEETVYRNKDTRDNAATWLMRFTENYKKEKGIDLDIPRWYQIKDKYDLKSKRIREKAKQDIAKLQGQIDIQEERLKRLESEYDILRIDGKHEQAAKTFEIIEKQKSKMETIVKKLESVKLKLSELKK